METTLLAVSAALVFAASAPPVDAEFRPRSLPAVELYRWLRARRRPCPFCAERIRHEASVCPHCQRDVTPPLSAAR
jgi:hypothetical protein